ncbi:MAG TPA: RNA polymerase sigma factor [Opitutaceae bacterium]|nr:RNA polymerase sigma factor [Opitutaceae bacterium]HRJ48071.1 RNA polymerase sigma factor [Opitutaceae bacterium]
MAEDPALSPSSRWLTDEVLPHEGALRAYLRGQFPTLRDIDDIVQESYLRLLETKRHHEIVSPRAYLFTTARNAALAQLRRPRIFSDEPVTELTGPGIVEKGPDTAETLNLKLEIALLMEAIDTLPARCREIFILRKLEGLPQKQIAARLGLSEQTVQVQLGRGIAKCAAYFRERGIVRC